MTDILVDNTDSEVLRVIGERFRSYRLQQNRTVADVARRAGLNPNTVTNAERGKNPRLMTLVRLLRVFGRLEALNAFLPPPLLSPLEVARRAGRPRQRARSRRDD